MPTSSLSEISPPASTFSVGEVVEQFPGTRKSSTARVLPLRELAADVRRLSEVSERKALFSVTRQWAVILITVALFLTVSSHLSWLAWVPAYILASLVIASRQHAFMAIVHEGAHFRLSRNRGWNDFLSDFFCAFPVGMSTSVYRRLHLLHHQFTNTSEDPDYVGMNMHEDWHWPKDHFATAKLFAFDLVGLAAHKIFFLLFMWSPWQAAVHKHIALGRTERVLLICFLGIAAEVLTLGHAWGWFFLLWLVPMATFLGAMVRMRSIAEHLVCPSENELNESRHVEATWIERLTIAPLNVNYHLAHHLFPSVPWYNLPKLQARMQQLDVFREHAKITSSYFGLKNGVLGEVLKPLPSRAS
jgi:fatty acid desaturase